LDSPAPNGPITNNSDPQPQASTSASATSSSTSANPKETEKEVQGGEPTTTTTATSTTPTCSREPAFTNYTADFKGCLDYIFISDDLKVEERLRLPSLTELEAKGLNALPSPHFPSDHLPLMCRFSHIIEEQNKDAKEEPPTATSNSASSSSS